MEWVDFVEKIEWDIGNLQKGFSLAVAEVEKEEGRPVYFGEVLYYLITKVGATAQLSKNAKERLLDLKREAIDANTIETVSVDSVLKARRSLTGTSPNKKIFVANFQKTINEKINALGKLGYFTKKLFPENEQFLYAFEDIVVTKSVFEKIENGKSGYNVALQFARWLAQKHKPKKTISNSNNRYLEPVSFRSLSSFFFHCSMPMRS